MKKYDWFRDVTWAGDKSSCLPPDDMSHGHVSQHNALRCKRLCFSFRNNKKLIAWLVGRHDMPSGDMNYVGGTNFMHVSRLTWQ